MFVSAVVELNRPGGSESKILGLVLKKKFVFYLTKILLYQLSCRIMIMTLPLT